MEFDANILVVDDEQGMRDMVELELTQRGHRVVTAADGTQALARMEEAEFDLVISDVRMPGADGLAVLRAAKASAPDTEVIIITGYTEIDAATECVRCGAFDLIHKPFHLVQFLAAVDRALNHRRLRISAVLYDACQEMFSEDGDLPLSERIARTAMRLLGADDVSVMLLDTNDSLRIVFSTGIPEAIQAETRLALGERVAGRVALDRAPAVLPEALGDDSRFEGIATYGRVRSGIIYPLVYQDTVLGVINLNRIESPRRFRKADLEIAGIVATQAALALRNERLAQHIVASERLAAIGQLAAGIVHEINNPLTYITSNAMFLRETLRSQPRDSRGWRMLGPKAEEKLEQALSDVEDGANRLTEIVADMRGLSRKELDTDERFDVSDAVRSAIRIAGPTLRYAAEVETKLGRELMVVGSPARLGQVFLNLLVNAADALETAGQPDRRIAVRSWCEDTRVLVAVVDNGPGIPAVHLSRIMEPFYTTKSKDQGSGLGLSISRDIVEQHGGRLRVASNPDGGATFTVSLPAAPACEESSPSSSSRQQTEERRTRILFVDDEAAIRRAVERFFGRWCEVQVAEDGARALEILQGELTFDVVVTDIAMPRMTGTDLFREVCQRWPTLSRRMLFVTGAVLEDRDTDLLQRSGVRVLPKPLDLGKLREEVERLLATAAGG